MFGFNFLLQPNFLSVIKHAFYFATSLTSSQPFVYTDALSSQNLAWAHWSFDKLGA